jgi:hypothetical protein
MNVGTPVVREALISLKMNGVNADEVRQLYAAG